MKALAAADIHGNYKVYHWLVEISHSISLDMLILAGDLLDSTFRCSTLQESQIANAKQIVKILKRLKVPVFYIMGNDDMIELPPSGYQFQSIHGRRLDFGKFNFVGYQYSLPFLGGIYEKKEEEMDIDLHQIEELMDSQTIFVSHNPAKDILDLGILKKHAGSQSIARLLERKPIRIHIHGHIHNCFGRWGNHFNVASSAEKRAMLIDLDTRKHLVISHNYPIE